jgi:hypothetical protein
VLHEEQFDLRNLFDGAEFAAASVEDVSSGHGGVAILFQPSNHPAGSFDSGIRSHDAERRDGMGEEIASELDCSFHYTAAHSNPIGQRRTICHME